MAISSAIPVRPLRAGLYHRASSFDQDPGMARRELHAAAQVRGVSIVLDIEETGSGRRNDRPGFQQLMRAARRGELDIVMVWRLARFGRSSPDLQASIAELRRLGVIFVATNQGIEVGPRPDAMTSLVVTILAGVAEFEVEQLREATIVGMRNAAGRGIHCGRPRLDLAGEQVAALRAQRLTWAEIGERLGCSDRTARRRYKGARQDVS